MDSSRNHALTVFGSLSKIEAIKGEQITINAIVEDQDGNLVEGATVEGTIGNLIIAMVDQGEGNYEGTIDTASLDQGTLNVIIEAGKEAYETSQDILAFVVLQEIVNYTNYIAAGTIIGAIAIFAIVFFMKRK